MVKVENPSQAEHSVLRSAPNVSDIVENTKIQYDKKLYIRFWNVVER